MSSTSFQPILDAALADYSNQAGINLASHPIADSLRSCGSPDDALKLLEDKANEFKDFRDGNRKLLNWLSPVVNVVHTLSAVFCASITLTASGVSSSYDALVDLFECLGNFLKRLQNLHRSPLYSFVDGDKREDNGRVAFRACSRYQTEKFAKKLRGEREIEGVLRRLDRLTQEESRMTTTQTLEVVYGLVNNVKVVINGAQRFSA
ncbi:hypothetical protein EDB92DRAFT_2018123 [Lactarius akahatsu]|uniref:Fungal STAND N-terminal Goodbye domain-containing protein n=1 Tax=Lactarius akahatsu TaxID=416441 RepID=A0AAD4QBL0_9AGAM|nr:hypothetical protein EDB92DRAFT_2018123 [Lactarius akahatsu]